MCNKINAIDIKKRGTANGVKEKGESTESARHIYKRPPKRRGKNGENGRKRN